MKRRTVGEQIYTRKEAKHLYFKLRRDENFCIFTMEKFVHEYFLDVKSTCPQM